MENGLFSLSMDNVKGALVSTILMAIISGAMYVLNLGDIFKIDGYALVNILVMSFLTGVVSLLKNLLTTNEGTIAGVKVK